MSLFKKPKRNFRQRISRNDSDEENNTEEAAEKSKPILESENIKTQKINIKIKDPTPVAKSSLSFVHEEEEENEIFKVKKSSYSRRLAKQLEKERKKKSQNGGKDPQGATKDLSSMQDDEKKEEESSPLAEEERTKVLNGEEAEEMEIDSNDEDEEEQKPDPFRRILESGAIPDAALIHAARKRRQMARELGDYVPVDDSHQYEKNNSRLVRDDDNDRSDDDDDDDDDDEDEGRISFSIKPPQQQRERVCEALLAVSKGASDNDEEQDDELERWEQEQIRKGVSIPQVSTTQVDTELYQTYVYQPQATLYQTETYTQPMQPPVPVDVKKPQAVVNQDPPLTVEAVKGRLKERLESLQQIHRAHQLENEKLQDSLVSSENHILQLEEQAPRVAKAFSFYQEMRGYVTDLVECLDEKVGIINMLEHDMHQLLKQWAARLALRRQQDIQDQSEDYSFNSNKALTAPNLEMSNREKLSSDSAKARRIAEREGRRTRRRKLRESKGTDLRHYEGMSSDDEEMEADIAKFNAERERIVAEASGVFEDVVEEFHSVSCIKARFETWKREYPESYKNAFIGLCLPKIFNPLVRLQILTWNPLKASHDFEELNWFESLMFYSYYDKLTIEDLKVDDDVQLIPFIVERVILPKLSGLGEHVWDPISTSQTLRFVSIVRRLVNEYPTVHGKSKNTQALLKAVIGRIRKTLDDDVYVPIYPKQVLENKSLGANAFFQRQFWSNVKLLRNVLSWQGLVSDQVLQELALDGILNRYLLLALQMSPTNKDTTEKAKVITATIPRCWFSQLKGDNTIPQLEPFCRYLKSCAETIDKNGSGGSLAEKTEVKESIKEIVKMLVNIGAMDHALRLVNQFSLKDLKMLVAETKDD